MEVLLQELSIRAKKWDSCAAGMPFDGFELTFTLREQRKRRRDNITAKTADLLAQLSRNPDFFLTSLADVVDHFIEGSRALSLSGEQTEPDSNVIPFEIVKRALISTSSVELRSRHFQAAHIYSELNTRWTLCKILYHADGALWDLSHNIAVLDLEQNNLGSEGAALLAERLLPRLCGLRRLHLASNGIGFYGLKALSRTTWGGPLEVLGLTNNNLYSLSVAGRQETSEQCESTDVSTCVAEMLLGLILAHRRSITRLHLNHVGLTTRTAVALIRQLRSWAMSADATETLSCEVPRWDMLYLKQNDAINMMKVLAALSEGSEQQGDRDGSNGSWVSRHVMW